MTMSFNEFVSKAMIVPFVEKGRDFNGWDCWGLIRVAYKEIFNIDLPSFIDDYKTCKDGYTRYIVKRHRPLFRNILKTEIGVGDGVLFNMVDIRNGGYMPHMGLLIDRKNFIHCRIGANTCKSSLDDFEWRPPRLEGFYRYAEFI